MAYVQLSWNANPSTDNTVRYEIERRIMGLSPRPSWLGRWSSTNLIGGWRRVGNCPGSQNTFTDGRTMVWRRWLRPTYKNNEMIHPDQAYEYRIRAINNFGVTGTWSHIRVGAISSGPTGPATNMQQLATQINNLPGQLSGALKGMADIVRRFITWLKS
ncbi:MAG: hypothetical protein ABIF10_07130 [Candidatus Woesearchaeota archaeon]